MPKTALAPLILSVFCSKLRFVSKRVFHFMADYWAFIEESGNSNLNFTRKNTSSHFIINAMVIESGVVPEVEQGIQKVLQTPTITDEVTPNQMPLFDNNSPQNVLTSLATNHEARIGVLQKLIELPFLLHYIVIDKRQLSKDDFRHWVRFYNLLNTVADETFFTKFPQLKIVAPPNDRQSKFVPKFARYIKGKHVPDLFSDANFRFVPKTGGLLSQLAFFLTETLAYSYEERLKTEITKLFVQMLKPKVIQSFSYTPDYNPFTHVFS